MVNTCIKIKNQDHIFLLDSHDLHGCLITNKADEIHPANVHEKLKLGKRNIFKENGTKISIFKDPHVNKCIFQTLHDMYSTYSVKF